MSSRAAQRAAKRRAAKRRAANKRKAKNQGKLAVEGVDSSYWKFIALVAAGTGLSPRVVAAWVQAEGGPIDNPLNIGPGRRYGTDVNAAKETIKLLKSSIYRDIMATAGKSDQDQLAAIVGSSWCPGCADYGHLLTSVYDDVSVSGFSGGTATGQVGTKADALDFIGDAVDDVTPDPLKDIVKFIARIFEPEFWLRVGKVLLGAVVLLLGGAVLAQAALGIDLNPARKAAAVGKAAYGRTRGYDEALEQEAAADKAGYRAQELREAKKTGARRAKADAIRKAQSGGSKYGDEPPF